MICRGGFHPTPNDDLPAKGNTLILVGNAGEKFWPAFVEGRSAGGDPLEMWSSSVLTEAADELGAAILFPFTGPPFLPFLSWAQRAEAVFPSPIGPLIHPDYGLWHAYRGALVFPAKIDLPEWDTQQISPCETCADKPCLTTCPVNAVGGDEFEFRACVSHIAQPAGKTCLSSGCEARRACPVGRDFLYPSPQAHFHMQAFLDTYGPG